MDTPKYDNAHKTSADMLRKYQDMILENQEDIDEDDEQVEEGKLPPALQAHIDAKKDKEDDEELSEDNLKDVSDLPKEKEEADVAKNSPVRKLKENDMIQRMQYLAGMSA